MSMDNYFLKMDKSLRACELNLLEQYIVCQIAEFKDKDMDCYVTNQQFADWTKYSLSMIEKTIKKLEEKRVIRRETKRLSKKQARVLTLRPRPEWDVVFENEDGEIFDDEASLDDSHTVNITGDDGGDTVNITVQNQNDRIYSGIIDNREIDNNRIDNKEQSSLANARQSSFADAQQPNPNESHSSDKKEKKGNKPKSIDAATFVRNLSLIDFDKVIKKVKTNGYIHYGSLHSWLKDNFNIHINDSFETLRDELLKRNKSIDKERKSDRKAQLTNLRSLPIEDIKSIVSSCDVYSEDMKDDEYDYKAHMIRSILRDRFGISSGVTQSNSELCVTMLRFARSGDRDRFVDDTEEW